MSSVPAGGGTLEQAGSSKSGLVRVMAAEKAKLSDVQGGHQCPLVFQSAQACWLPSFILNPGFYA